MKKSELLAFVGLLIAAGTIGWQLVVEPAPHPPPPAKPVHVEVRPEPEPQTSETEETHVASLATPILPPQDIKPPSFRRPTIAIVIDDMGLNLSGSRRAIKLPDSITLSYMPYAERLDEQTADAKDHGHELLLHMPMEPMGRQDPGPGALFTNLSSGEILSRLDKALNSFEGFDGINNHMGSRFTAYEPGMEIVIAELKKRGVFFLDSRTSAQTVGEKLAMQHGLPTIARDVFLDDSTDPAAIKAQLAATEKVAKRRGFAVAIGHPHQNTLTALEEWIPEAEKSGFVFVPLHDLVKARALAVSAPQ